MAASGVWLSLSPRRSAGGPGPLPKPAPPAAPPPPTEDRSALEEVLEEHRRSLDACMESGLRLEGLIVDLASSLEARDTRLVWKGVICDSTAELGRWEHCEARGAPLCLSCDGHGCSLCQGRVRARDAAEPSGCTNLPRDASVAEGLDSKNTSSRTIKGELPSVDVSTKRIMLNSHSLSNHMFSRGCLGSYVSNVEMRLLEPPHPTTGILGRLVASKKFELCSAFVIIANAVYIAHVSDLDVKDVANEEATLISAWFWMEIAFTTWYALEWTLRVAVYRSSFFLCKDWSWNVFDTVLVALSLEDIVMSVGMANPAFLRVMRLARMLKLLRVIRLLRMFRELRLILNAILSCVKSMFWAMLLIINVSFIFGLCFVQATADYLREQKGRVDENQKDTLLQYWGSCRTAMYSLYAAALGGIDWDVEAATLRPVGTLFFLLFLLYVGFFFCVITNTLTSLFVEATMDNALKDQQQVIQAELEQKEVYIQQLQSLFLKFGGQGTGEVTLQDFIAHMDDPEMIWFAANLGIDIVDLKQFFSVLSSGGRQLVDLEHFVVGCIRLKGAAKSMDLMDMKLTLKQESVDVRESLKSMERKIEALAGVVGAEAPRRRESRFESASPASRAAWRVQSS